MKNLFYELKGFITGFIIAALLILYMGQGIDAILYKIINKMHDNEPTNSEGKNLEKKPRNKKETVDFGFRV